MASTKLTATARVRTTTSPDFGEVYFEEATARVPPGLGSHSASFVYVMLRH
jgi:hypothetical protein